MTRFTISLNGTKLARIKRVSHGEPCLTFEGAYPAKTYDEPTAKGFVTTLRRYGYEPVVNPA